MIPPEVNLGFPKKNVISWPGPKAKDAKLTLLTEQAEMEGRFWIPVRLLRLDWLALALSPEPGRFAIWAPWVFCFGIASWFTPQIEPSVILIPVLLGIAVLSAGALFFWKPQNTKLVFLAIMLCVFFSGSLIAQIRSHSRAAPVLPTANHSWLVTGKLFQVDRETGKRARYLIRVQEIEGLPVDRLPKFVRIGGFSSPARIGAIVRFRASMQAPSPTLVPGGFSFARNAWFQQIGATGFTLGRLEVLEPPSTLTLSLRVSQWRNRLSKSLRTKIAGQNGALAAALITGDRSAIEEENIKAFREAGLAHLLAISGLHMSLIGGFVFVAFSMIFAAIPAIGAKMDARKPAAIVGILVSFGYLVISGGAAPAQRAFIMLGLIFLAVLTGRRALSIRTISLAAFFIALLSPEYVVSPGFQMSFAASLALIAFYQRFGSTFVMRHKQNHQFGAVVGGVQKSLFFLAGVAATSLIAGLATAPFASWHFHKIALFSLLGNLAAMPVFTILVIPFLFLGVCLMPLGLEPPFFAIASFGLDAIQAIARFTSSLPGAVWDVGAASPISLLLESVALILICLVGKRVIGLVLVLVMVSIGFRIAIPSPMLWVGDKGGAIVFSDKTNHTIYTFGKPDKFSLRQFAENAGLSSVETLDISKAPNVSCDNQGCVAQLEGRTVAIRYTNEDIATDCALADLVLIARSLNERQGSACQNTRLLSSRQDGGTVFYRGSTPWRWKKPENDRLWDRARNR
jgi:competence protein ComEC